MKRFPLPLEEMVDRRVYRIVSRNLIVGVWDAKESGFIGIREKFGSLYLFTEYHTQTGGSLGTAVAVRDLGVDVPAEIPLDEDFKQTDGRLFALLERIEEPILAELKAEREAEELERASLEYRPQTLEEYEIERRMEEVRGWRRAQMDRLKDADPETRRATWREIDRELTERLRRAQEEGKAAAREPLP